jgi:hypothetical protein
MANRKTSTPKTTTTAAKAAPAAKAPAAKPAPKAAPKHTKGKLEVPAQAPAPSAAPDKSPPFLTEDPKAAFDHYSVLCPTFPDGSLKHLNVAPDLLVNNTKLGIDAWKPIQDEVVAQMPACPVNRFLELPSLSLAVLYASDKVVDQASTGEIASRLASVARLRTPMLDQLSVLASPTVGLADPARVKAIRAGSGSLDKAHDAVNIAAYFAELGTAIEGKHPFTEGQLAQLAEDGQWLIQQLTPGQAVPAPAAADPAAAMRDRLFTWLAARYDAFRAAAAVALGVADLDAHVPSLGTRVPKPKKAAPAPGPAPTPAPPPAPAPAVAPAAGAVMAPAAPGK